MKTNFYFLPVLAVGLLLSEHLNAQCGLRYVDSLFQYSITTVTYDVYDSAMDIYQPIGDTSSKRPVMILAHGGTFIAGNKTDDPCVIGLCRNYASRGYVTVSINYRLLTSAELIGDEVSGDTTAIIAEVIQALSDGKAAVRYLSMDAATTNLYRIDTTKMFIGGNSAGAVLAMQYGYIDSIQQATPYLQGVINANGGLEGNSGNAGYNSKVAAVISCAGGLNDPGWIVPGSIPSFNAQGTYDSVVPYIALMQNMAKLVSGYAVWVRFSRIMMRPISMSRACFFPGQGHVPWDNNAAMFYSLDSALSAFLVTNFVTPDSFCNTTSGVNEVIAINANIDLFPNPATNMVNLSSSLPLRGVSIYDETGREVMYIDNINTSTYQINTSELSKGVYFLKLETAFSAVPTVKRLILE